MAARTLHLTVLVGATGETPSIRLSRDAIDALTSVSVQSSAEARSGFQLSFETDRRRVVDELLRLFQYGLSPAVRVLVVVVLGGALHVLSDGVVTQHQNATTAAGRTTLSFTGEDLSVLMDLVDKTGTPLASANDYAQVNALLAPYLGFGVVPLVVPSPFSDFGDPTAPPPTQLGTDYAQIAAKARRAGYVFHLIPGPAPGQSLAYWGPEVQVPVPEPALTLGAGLANNVAQLSFTHATQQHALPLIQLKVDKSAVSFPLPDTGPLRAPLTAAPQPAVRTTRFTDDEGKTDPLRAIGAAVAQAARSSDNVTGSGQLDVREYGRLLRPRAIVGVRGMSLSYDGLYFVSRVSTELRRGRCTQSFSLKRSGAFPIGPRVNV